MKKVAIVSCYFKNNYGSALQAYATQKILDQWGVANETIRISGFLSEIQRGKRKFYMRNLCNVPFLNSKKGFVAHALRERLDPQGFGRQMGLRKQAFARFREQFRLSPAYASKQELRESCSTRYSAVLLGSDQLWLPVNICGDYYTLNFAPDAINKVAYATSFGVSAIPNWLQEDTRRFLGRIAHISVREQSGQALVKELTGKEAPVVCDPTMLFTGENWMEVQQQAPIVRQPYLFCYFLGENQTHRHFAQQLQKRLGVPIVTLRHMDAYIPKDNGFGDYAPYDVGPAEFLNLLRNAAYICTDSFHGTVFSILYHKPFSTFKRFQSSGRYSTNSRLESLLHLLQLEGRLCTSEDDLQNCLKAQIDYTAVDKLLQPFRAASYAYLKGALHVEGAQNA